MDNLVTALAQTLHFGVNPILGASMDDMFTTLLGSLGYVGWVFLGLLAIVLIMWLLRKDK